MNYITDPNDTRLNKANFMVSQAKSWLAEKRADLSSATIDNVATTLGNIAGAEDWIRPNDEWTPDSWMEAENFGAEVGPLIASVKESIDAEDTLAEFLGSIANMLGWKVS